MINIVSRAARFAADKHQGQFRDYPDTFGLTEPYIMHPARVAGMVAANHSLFPAYRFDEIMAAAWLHDVIEDCGVDVDTLVNEFGLFVATMVGELTNTSEFGTREQRKFLDRQRLKGVGREAKIVKMYDRIDNLRSMVNAPENFALLYLDESEALAEALRDADRLTYNVLAFTINAVRKRVKTCDYDSYPK